MSSHRLDAKFNENASVACPYATRPGFHGVAKAERGDLLTFTLGSETGSPVHTGRFLARVDASGADGGEKVEGFIQVLVISHDMRQVYERWVDPAWVKTVQEFTGRLARWFCQPSLPDRETLLHLHGQGYLHEDYIEKAKP